MNTDGERLLACPTDTLVMAMVCSPLPDFYTLQHEPDTSKTFLITHTST